MKSSALLLVLLGTPSGHSENFKPESAKPRAEINSMKPSKYLVRSPVESGIWETSSNLYQSLDLQTPVCSSPRQLKEQLMLQLQLELQQQQQKKQQQQSPSPRPKKRDFPDMFLCHLRHLRHLRYRISIKACG